ncbi:MAG: sugar phosphate isomerase/epimerase family protein, partial [Anaerolineae bacterium]
MARIPIALQLYSVREACAEDLPGTLKAVADMGYDGVDFAGYYGYSAQELRSMLDDLGLEIAGTHIRIDALLGQQLEATVAFEQQLGNKFLIVPGLPEEYRSSHDAWRRTAASPRPAPRNWTFGPISVLSSRTRTCFLSHRQLDCRRRHALRSSAP